MKISKEKRKERENIDNLREHLEDSRFVLEREWIISMLRFKLQLIDIELNETYHRPIITKIESRIKSLDSISRKLDRKGHPCTFEMAMNKLNDIVGVRAVCLYCDDIYRVAELIREQKDIHIVKEKDYIKTPKKSGYQSLHLIVELPFTDKDVTRPLRAEVQIRSVAMDYWAGVDNQMCYKKNVGDHGTTESTLKSYSDIISKIDKQMLELRKKVENKS